MDYFADIEQTVAAAIREDIGTGDLTASLIDADQNARAQVITRDPAVICGIPWANEVIRQIDPTIAVKWLVKDGEQVEPEQLLLDLEGNARSLLTVERSMLNFLQLLSGTATRTREYVDQVADTKVQLLDTRKTIPGLRLAQKYAVKIGGADNHRIGLFDAFLIKENHIAAAGSVTAAINGARQTNGEARMEVEVENLQQLGEALQANPDWIMLDNFSTEHLKMAVRRAKNFDIKLEASGGIENFQDLKKIAATGVDFISLGTLTKHITAIDLSMRME